MATPEQIAAGVPASANIVAQVPDGHGGTLYLGDDGGVFATGGAQFYGSVPGLQGDSLAGKHQFAGNGLTLGPNGGYVETDTAGHQYAFGTPAPNPLAQDPATLAFWRTSGLTADQAVRDYENQVGLAQRARDAALAELNDPFGAQAQGRQKLLQGNVDNGRAGALVQQDMTGYDTETANKAAGLQSSYTDAVNQAGRTESDTLGGIAQKGIEQGLDTGDKQGWNSFWQGEAQKYPDQATDILKNISTGSTANG